MARVKCYLPSLKEAFSHLCGYPGSDLFYNENSIQNSKTSKTIEEIVKAVESNTNWLNIRACRKNIEKIVIGIEIRLNQIKVDRWIEIHYNLTKSKIRREKCISLN